MPRTNSQDELEEKLFWRKLNSFVTFSVMYFMGTLAFLIYESLKFDKTAKSNPEVIHDITLPALSIGLWCFSLYLLFLSLYLRYGKFYESRDLETDPYRARSLYYIYKKYKDENRKVDFIKFIAKEIVFCRVRHLIISVISGMYCIIVGIGSGGHRSLSTILLLRVSVGLVGGILLWDLILVLLFIGLYGICLSARRIFEMVKDMCCCCYCCCTDLLTNDTNHNQITPHDINPNPEIAIMVSELPTYSSLFKNNNSK